MQTIILLKHRRGIVSTPRRSVYYFADHKGQSESSSDTSPCWKLYQQFSAVCGNDKSFLAKRNPQWWLRLWNDSFHLWKLWLILADGSLSPTLRSYISYWSDLDPNRSIPIYDGLYRSTLIHLKSAFNHTNAMLTFAKYADVQSWICDSVFTNTKLLIISIGMRDMYFQIGFRRLKEGPKGGPSPIFSRRWAVVENGWRQSKKKKKEKETSGRTVRSRVGFPDPNELNPSQAQLDLSPNGPTGWPNKKKTVHWELPPWSRVTHIL